MAGADAAGLHRRICAEHAACRVCARSTLGNEVGPEHIAIGPDGKLYAAMTSGNLLRMEPDGGKQEVFANTGGRVLGFDFDARGRMIAADAIKGLLAITAGPARDRAGRSREPR